MFKSSLRQQLILPFVLMVGFVASAIGWVSFQATTDAVSALTQRLLLDMTYRVDGMSRNYLAETRAFLESALPDADMPPRGTDVSDNLLALEERFWRLGERPSTLAKYVYFGGADGRFVGLDRAAAGSAELYLRHPGDSQRTVYEAVAPGDRRSKLRSDEYDPRQRPWYRAAVGRAQAVWAPVYSDYTSSQPTITFAKPVYRANHQLAGVMAIDMPLTTLADSLKTLAISEHGVAFLMDSDGMLIASSHSGGSFQLANSLPQPNRIQDARSELIREAGARALGWVRHDAMRTSRYQAVTLTSGVVKMAAARVDDHYGLGWTVVVAAPRADFMQGVVRSLYNGLLIAGVCIVLALLLGLSILNRALSDIRKLTDAAKKIGDGEPLPRLQIHRNDELGQLARTFSEMERNLRTDRLTGAATREWLLQQIALLQRRGQGQRRVRFGLLFIDLDNFKFINDHYGHEAGDRVLVAVATRIKLAVRSSDIVARYGGDEFVVLLKGMGSIREVFAAEKKIVNLVAQPIELRQGTETIGASIGWALFPHDGQNLESLLKIADERMFVAKKQRKAGR